MTLIVLAAGMGSRLGGIKQLTPLTNEGEYIIDFTVYDALKAGFDRIIFIIRKDIEDVFEERIGAKLRKNGVKFSYDKLHALYLKFLEENKGACFIMRKITQEMIENFKIF